MGCASHTRCLGPKLRERQVYQNLIEAIYQEVNQITIPQNQDQYECIKNALVKKGLLRKLTDNLKSHKNNIYSCVDQNFQISSQSKLFNIRITSLILVDAIMEELLIVHKNGYDANEKYNSTEQLLSHHVNGKGQQGSFGEGIQFDQRVDRIFLRQIVFLVENEKQIQERVISSMMLFCEYRQQKIIYKNEVYSIFQYLYKKTNKKGSLKYIKAFQLLLRKSKDNIKDQEKDAKYIKLFMSLNSNKDVAIVAQQILKKYIQKYFGEYIIFYQSMAQLLDSCLFESSKSERTWQVMLDLSKQQDNYSNFIRGLFVFILRYIMVHQQLSVNTKLNYKLQQFNQLSFKNILREQCKLNAFKMITKLLVNNFINVNQAILYASNLIVMAYLTNYLYGRSQTMKEYLKKEFYQIISLLNGKQDLIITSLLIEEIRQKQTRNKKRKMLMVIIKEILLLKKMVNNIDNTSIGNIFIIIQPYYSMQVKLQIITYMKFILKSIKSEYVNGTSYDSKYLHQKLCIFLYSFYASIIEDQQIQEETQIFLRANFVRKSRNSQDVNPSNLIILQRSKYTAELVSIVKILLEQHFYIVVVSFLENINDAMLIVSQHNQKHAYLLLFFIQLIKRHTLFLINKRDRIPQQMIKLHLKIQDGQITSTLSNDVRTVILKVIDQYHMSFPVEQNERMNGDQQIRGKINFIMRSDNRRIQATKQFYMFNQLQYSQIFHDFKQYFRASGVSSKKDAQNLGQIQLFNRNSQTNQSNQQLDRAIDHLRYQEDESFRDIITKINGT